MSLFSSFSNWIMGGLKRSKGVQYPTPMSYSEDAASTVTYDSAMQLSAVWACVKLLSETVASLPLNVYKKTENGRKIHKNHDLHVLFSGKVNRYQTKVEFFETVMLNLVTQGNAYCLIQRTGGRITGLLPIMSSQVEVMMLDDGSLVYNYTNDSGVTVLAESSVWHLKLMGNGTIGMSPLAYQRNSLGIAQAAESAVTKIYRNGAKPSGVLTMDRVLTPAQRDQIRANFATLTTSQDDRLLVLEGGMKFDTVSLSPQDIELLASRKFQIAEICRWYGIPSVMVNDANGTSVWGSGIDSVMQGFYKMTLRPLLEKIEASVLSNLVAVNERDKVEVEFDFDALLRADVKSRYDSYRIGITAGLMTPNEARELENLPPMEGGEKLLIQGAMMPVDKLGVAPEPVPEPVDTAPIEEGIKALSAEIKHMKDFVSIKAAQPVHIPAQQPVNVNVDTNDFVKAAKSIEEMAAKSLKQIREDIQNMPIVIPAPEVHVEAIMPEIKQVPPSVNVYNEVRPADVTVIDNHPKRAVQTVERNSADEIVRTVINYE